MEAKTVGRVAEISFAPGPARVDLVWEQALRLLRDRKPFAVATVVRSLKPTSARPGSRAIVHPDGRMEGFIGGQCTGPVVVSQALECLRKGENRLLLITSQETESVSRPGVVAVPMTCHSEGTVELFIEAHLPAPVLVIVGNSPVASALADMARHTEFEVHSLSLAEGPVQDEEPESAERSGRGSAPARDLEALLEVLRSLAPGAYVVAATMGQYDEVCVQAALEGSASYVGLVASRRRKDVLVEGLIAAGVDPRQAAGVTGPAGLDIGAKGPGEIAVSILAQLMETRRKLESEPRVDSALALAAAQDGGRAQAGAAQDGGGTQAAAARRGRRESVDPVCRMVVDLNSTPHRAVHRGKEYGFCCAHCREAFLKDPDQYVTEAMLG